MKLTPHTSVIKRITLETESETKHTDCRSFPQDFYPHEGRGQETENDRIGNVAVHATQNGRHETRTALSHQILPTGRGSAQRRRAHGTVCHPSGARYGR